MEEHSAGKLLVECLPERGVIRVVRRKRPFVVDLRGHRFELVYPICVLMSLLPLFNAG